jgi:hypothetical protein
MEHLCMDENSGWMRSRESVMGLLRLVDQDSSVEGMPEVPPEFQSLLVATPAVAQVVELLGHAVLFGMAAPGCARNGGDAEFSVGL